MTRSGDKKRKSMDETKQKEIDQNKSTKRIKQLLIPISTFDGTIGEEIGIVLKELKTQQQKKMASPTSTPTKSPSKSKSKSPSKQQIPISPSILRTRSPRSPASQTIPISPSILRTRSPRSSTSQPTPQSPSILRTRSPKSPASQTIPQSPSILRSRSPASTINQVIGIPKKNEVFLLSDAQRKYAYEKIKDNLEETSINDCWFCSTEAGVIRKRKGNDKSSQLEVKVNDCVNDIQFTRCDHIVWYCNTKQDLKLLSYPALSQTHIDRLKSVKGEKGNGIGLELVLLCGNLGCLNHHHMHVEDTSKIDRSECLESDEKVICCPHIPLCIGDNVVGSCFIETSFKKVKPSKTRRSSTKYKYKYVNSDDEEEEDDE